MALKNSSKAFLDGTTIGTADLDAGAVTAAKLAIGAVNGAQSLSVVNKTGSNIAIGKLVSVSGYDTGTGLPKIVLADQGVSAGLAAWVLTAQINNNASGTVYKSATITGVDTSSASAAGDPVYLGVSGGFTISLPTSQDRQGQLVGAVITKNASTGSVLIDLNSAQEVSLGSTQLLAACVLGTKLSTVGATKELNKPLITNPIATTGSQELLFIAPCAGTLAAVWFTAKDALAANDTNFITWALTNKGPAGAGATAMLSATAGAATTKATGGQAIAAYTKQAIPLSGTGANLVVAAGDTLAFTATVTGTLANTVSLPEVELQFTFTT